MTNYRLVTFYSTTSAYLEIVKDVKVKGRWTTKAVLNFGRYTEEKKKIAEKVVNLLKKYARKNSPIPYDTLDNDFLAGLYLGINLKLIPISSPPYPPIPFKTFKDLAETMLEKEKGMKKLVDATQYQLSDDERKRFLEWLKKIKTKIPVSR